MRSMPASWSAGSRRAARGSAPRRPSAAPRSPGTGRPPGRSRRHVPSWRWRRQAMATTIRDRLVVSAEVASGLAEGWPVVALESTLISHGLPYPQNLEVAAASEAAARAAGAVPATIAIHGGRLLVGLDAAALESLATAPPGTVRKAARPSLAAALADG